MVACAVPADKIAESVRAYPTTYPPAIGVVSNQGSFQRVPSAVLGGPQERVQGGMQGGVQGPGGLGGHALQDQMAQMKEMEQLSEREEQGLQEQLPQVAQVAVVVDYRYESEVS